MRTSEEPDKYLMKPPRKWIKVVFSVLRILLLRPSRGEEAGRWSDHVPEVFICASTEAETKKLPRQLTHVQYVLVCLGASSWYDMHQTPHPGGTREAS